MMKIIKKYIFFNLMFLFLIFKLPASVPSTSVPSTSVPGAAVSNTSQSVNFKNFLKGIEKTLTRIETIKIHDELTNTNELKDKVKAFSLEFTNPSESSPWDNDKVANFFADTFGLDKSILKPSLGGLSDKIRLFFGGEVLLPELRFMKRLKKAFKARNDDDEYQTDHQGMHTDDILESLVDLELATEAKLRAAIKNGIDTKVVEAKEYNQDAIKKIINTLSEKKEYPKTDPADRSKLTERLKEYEERIDEILAEHYREDGQVFNSYSLTNQKNGLTIEFIVATDAKFTKALLEKIALAEASFKQEFAQVDGMQKSIDDTLEQIKESITAKQEPNKALLEKKTDLAAKIVEHAKTIEEAQTKLQAAEETARRAQTAIDEVNAAKAKIIKEKTILDDQEKAEHAANLAKAKEEQKAAQDVLARTKAEQKAAQDRQAKAQAEQKAAQDRLNALQREHEELI